MRKIWTLKEHENSPYDVFDSLGGLIAGSINVSSLSESDVFEVITSGGKSEIYQNLSEFLSAIGGSLLSGKESDTIGFESFGSKRGITSISVK